MASLSAFQKLLYQILIRASKVGIFSSFGLSRKWRSMAPAPWSNCSKFCGPTAKQILKPTLLHNENRPPTQSFIGNTFWGSIPKAAIFSKFVETAIKCCAIADSAADCRNHLRMLVALVRVSCVVNVLETIKNKVVSGFIFFKISWW